MNEETPTAGAAEVPRTQEEARAALLRVAEDQAFREDHARVAGYCSKDDLARSSTLLGVTSSRRTGRPSRRQFVSSSSMCPPKPARQRSGIRDHDHSRPLPQELRSVPR